MPRIRFTLSAETDLLELWVTIAEENPTAADETLDVIQTTATLQSAQPEMGRTRPELARRIAQSVDSHAIPYLPDDDGLLVFRVLHHARDIDAEYFS